MLCLDRSLRRYFCGGGINMPRPIHNTEKLSIYISPETMDGLRGNLTKERKSMSEYVRWLIECDIKFNTNYKRVINV